MLENVQQKQGEIQGRLFWRFFNTVISQEGQKIRKVPIILLLELFSKEGPRISFQKSWDDNLGTCYTCTFLGQLLL